MAELHSGFECCGLMEFAHIADNDTPEQALTVALSAIGGAPSCSHIIFTGAGSKKTVSAGGPAYASVMLNYIVEHKLGTVTPCSPNLNPNSGNYVIPYVWAINRPALTRWWKRQMAKNADGDY